MIGSLRLRLGDLLRRLRPSGRRPGPPPPPGKLRNVVVVKPRDPRFQEVIYVLREEGLPGAAEERKELLRQALEAARAETGRALPRDRPPAFWPAAALVLGAALILKLCGLW